MALLPVVQIDRLGHPAGVQAFLSSLRPGFKGYSFEGVSPGRISCGEPQHFLEVVSSLLKNREDRKRSLLVGIGLRGFVAEAMGTYRKVIQ